MQTMTQFLKEQFLSASCYDPAKEIKAFREDMERGLRGDSGSLFMIPSFLSPEGEQVEDCTVIVLDAGGTNLRVGTVTFAGGVVSRVDFEKVPLPGTEREMTCLEFFDAVAAHLAPYLEKSDKIGFCFSYVAHCMENKDARLEAFCKEVKVTGAEGVEICRELDNAIARRGIKRNYRYVQLNDTVATMLGGMATSRRADYDGYVGCILGTGTNICYGEKTEKITKYTGSAYTEPAMIVNMESGCYKGFPKGEIDRYIDSVSAIPGDHQAEKLVSGAYAGAILAEAVRRAHDRGIMEGTVSCKQIPLAEVGKFLAGENNEITAMLPENDLPAMRELIEGLFSRTARLMAIEFTAIALHTGAGKHKPLCIVMEGSTYQKSPRLQAFLRYELEYMTQCYGCDFKVICAENPTLTGAAFAAVPNH